MHISAAVREVLTDVHCRVINLKELVNMAHLHHSFSGPAVIAQTTYTINYND